MSDKYILDEVGNAVAEPDLMKWARWFEKKERHLADDRIGDVRVSTIFLGIDHRFGDDGPPMLWETMIFGGPHNEYQERYSTKAEAEAGHRVAVALAGTMVDPSDA